MVGCYFYGDTPIPALLGIVPAILYPDIKVPSYEFDHVYMVHVVCF